MNKYEIKFVDSLKDGYINYLTIHARSSKKILPMHKCISEILKEKLGSGYTIKSMGVLDNKEFVFSGKYYDKDLDITILKDGIPISAIGFKFITSNYKQNSNNYFENMLGETANLRRNDLLYAQILIIKQYMPYYSIDKKKYTKFEKVNEKNLSKYLKLNNDSAEQLYHKPDILFIGFINTGDEIRLKKAIDNKEKIIKTEFNKNELLPLVNIELINVDKLDESFSEKMLSFLKLNGDFDSFITAFVNLTKGKTYGKRKL